MQEEHPSNEQLFDYAISKNMKALHYKSIPWQVKVHIIDCKQCSAYQVVLENLARTLRTLNKKDLKPPTPCPDSLTFAAYVQGDVDSKTARSINAHMAFCDECCREYLGLADPTQIIDAIAPDLSEKYERPGVLSIGRNTYRVSISLSEESREVHCIVERMSASDTEEMQIQIHHHHSTGIVRTNENKGGLTSVTLRPDDILVDDVLIFNFIIGPHLRTLTYDIGEQHALLKNRKSKRTLA